LQLRFAVFIMTYRRPDLLRDTVQKIKEQTVAPQKILVIDNDPGQSAKIICESFNTNEVEYLSMGTNTGPAGAAYKGLSVLAAEGYKWIGWMDDDDPPVFKDVFENLLHIAESNHECGSTGVAGQYYNIQTGMIERVSDDRLIGNGVLEVDNIAGNMCKIVNGEMIRTKNILPDEDLFFGFEELAFDLKIKKNNYRILTGKELYLRHRTHYNRIGFDYRRGLKKETNRLWRDYYSSRNSLYILFRNRFYSGLLLTLLRLFAKTIAGFRYGWRYGSKNAKYTLLALLHFCTGVKGKTIQPSGV
jgi:GT2 family glycosyltransferase